MKAEILDSIKQARCSMNRLYMAIRTSDIKDIECRMVTEHLLKIHHSCIQITELMDDIKSMKANELKATDLMVGDWLMFNDKPCQVKGLHNDDTVTLTGYNSAYYLIDAEPIPLTPEILEKNGLANGPYGCYFKEDEYMALEISVEREGIYWTINYNEYGILKLKYVHQLQHALKLCRIDKEIVVW